MKFFEDTGGDTTQEMDLPGVQHRRPSLRFAAVLETALNTFRKKEKLKALEGLAQIEQDKVDNLWPELEKKREQLDRAQGVLKKINEQIQQEKEEIIALEDSLPDPDQEAQGEVRETLRLILDQSADESSSPYDVLKREVEASEGDGIPEEPLDAPPSGEGDLDRTPPTNKFALQAVYVGVKRGRGRPPKQGTPARQSGGQKRGRGRPPKSVESKPGGGGDGSSKKRGRGRPRKYQEAADVVIDELEQPIKRPRGRPRKSQT